MRQLATRSGAEARNGSNDTYTIKGAWCMLSGTVKYKIYKKEYEMNKQIPLQRSLLGTNKLVIAGGILLMCGISFLLAFGVGYQHDGAPAMFLDVLSRPAIITGLMFVFLGLVRKMKQGSLRWLRIT